MVRSDAVQLSMLRAELLSEHSLRLLGNPLAVRLVLLLEDGAQRFTTLHNAVGGSTKTVSARLKELEEHGLLSKTTYAEVPVRTVYGLTRKGREFADLLRAIAAWDASWTARSDE